jgi:hypothetical protein
VIDPDSAYKSIIASARVEAAHRLTGHESSWWWHQIEHIILKGIAIESHPVQRPAVHVDQLRWEPVELGLAQPFGCLGLDSGAPRCLAQFGLFHVLPYMERSCRALATSSAFITASLSVDAH